jgi:hypothetical protein
VYLKAASVFDPKNDECIGVIASNDCGLKVTVTVALPYAAGRR